MPNLSATLRLRPVRMGFLVDPTDLASLRQVMELCTCLWGGIYNPIIPVCSAVPDIWKFIPALAPSAVQLAGGYINFFEPDVYVQAVPEIPPELNLSDGEIDFGSPRLLQLSSLTEEDPDTRDSLVGLSMLGVYQSLFDREYRFVPRHPANVAVLKGASPESQAFTECTLGAFPAAGRFALLANAYKDAFQPEEMESNATSWLKIFEHRYRFPLSFTRHSIDRAPGGHGFGEPILFVLDPSSGHDLLDFWNLRLFHQYVLPINVHWFEELSAFMRDFIARNHRPMPRNPHGVMLHTTVEFGRSIGEPRAKELVHKHLQGLAVGSWAFKLWYDHIWGKYRDADQIARPRRSQFTAKSTDLSLQVSEEARERTVSFDTISPDFAPTYGHGALGWVNVLRFNHLRYSAEPFPQLPCDFDLAAARRLRIGSAVIPSREGLVLPQQFKGHREYIKVLTGREVMIDWLKQHGVDAHISSSGRVTEQVIASLGGVSQVKVIADAQTLQLLDKMAKSVREYQDGTVEEYADRTASVQEWTGLIARRSQDIWSRHFTLEKFIDAGVLKLGLSIPCTHCTFDNWFSIAELDEVLNCERCRKPYAFPQGSLNYVHSPWRFRVVGPFAVPNYADGAYATALTLRVFADTLATGDVSLTYAPGLNFLVSGRKPFEVDFSCWFSRAGWREEQEVLAIFGEAKSFGEKSFDSKDILRMRQVAELFPGSFLAFTTLKDTLHDDERRLIAELAQWGRDSLQSGEPRAPVIVLTGAELFCPWHLNHTWKELDGLRKQFSDGAHTRLDNLWTLADVTQQVYLNLPSRFEEMRKKWEASGQASRPKDDGDAAST
jgi:hypothetical protein